MADVKTVFVVIETGKDGSVVCVVDTIDNAESYVEDFEDEGPFRILEAEYYPN